MAYQLSYPPIFIYFSGLDLIVDCLFAIGVKRFVYISSADFGLANYLLQGYYEGKVLFSLLAVEACHFNANVWHGTSTSSVFWKQRLFSKA